MRAGAGVSAGAGRSILDREGAESPELDPIAARHRADDLAENGIDDVLDITLIKMRVLRRNALHKLRLDHCRLPPRLHGPPSPPSRPKGAKGPADRQG